MKITALYNGRGAILAAVAVDDAYRGPVPVASRGTKVGVFDVPESVGKRRLDEICTSLRVDVRSQRLVEAKRAPASPAANRSREARKPGRRRTS